MMIECIVFFFVMDKYYILQVNCCQPRFYLVLTKWPKTEWHMQEWWMNEDGNRVICNCCHENSLGTFCKH